MSLQVEVLTYPDVVLVLLGERSEDLGQGLTDAIRLGRGPTALDALLDAENGLRTTLDKIQRLLFHERSKSLAREPML